MLTTVALFGAACGGSATMTDTATPVTDDDATAASASSSEDDAADGADDSSDDAIAAEPAPEPPGDDTALSWDHDWTGELLGGGQFDANDLAGQDVVLWFWAPW